MQYQGSQPSGSYLFPAGFLWGCATAAHQVEGGNHNNTWAVWEQEKGRIIQDQKAGLACDWWGGRWREDFDRAAEGQQNAHRLSVEWSRIQPTPDVWDEDALERYRAMLRGLKQRGITPMVTLHHFTDPLWLAEKGGWEDPNVVTRFEAFARKTVDALKEYCSLWVTINEPNVFAVEAYQEGLFPPGKRSQDAMLTVLYHMALAHAAAYRAIHALQPSAQVGIALQYRSLRPKRAWLPLDTIPAGILSQVFNNLLPQALTSGRFDAVVRKRRIPEAAGTQDFLGINYYTREFVRFAPLRPAELFSARAFRPGAELSETGFLANEPDGMYEALKWGKRFGLPMYVTENGVESADDRIRPRYLLAHIHQVWRAVNFNWLIRGYFHWTLVDNFEWERGWTQRFGLWELDPETQVRRKRPSADLYAEICRQNGITAETVQRYAPELYPALYPRG